MTAALSLFRLSLVVILLATAAADASAQLGGFGARQLDPDGPMRVILLGTGIPLPNPERATAATLVIAGDRAMLVDTGRNCVVRLAQSGIADVTSVFYTHYHSDHIAGLGELLVTRGIAGADKPLPIIGPPGAQRVVDGFAAAYALEDSYRVAHHGKNWRKGGSQAEVTEAEPGVVYEKDGLKVTMFNVDHDPVRPAVGYRFDYQDKSVVVSGDTKKTPKLIEMSKDVDILVHEAVNRNAIDRIRPLLRARNPRQDEMIGDMIEHHTSTIEVAEIAQEAGVKKLVLTHLVPSIPPQERAEKNFIQGMSDIYAGPILVGRDGMVIEIE